MQALTEILYPYSVQEFLDEYWTRQAVLIFHARREKFERLFSWEKLTNLLNFHKIDYPELRLSLNGKVLDASENENLIQRCQEGATLIVNGVHRRIPEIATLTSQICYELGCGAQVNAYCSYPGKQGFSIHYDTHEVFILQIAGKKQWHIFPDTFKYPLSEHPSKNFPPPEEKPYLSGTLKPGDVLYIPRGHWHYAVAADEPSLHLTLGLHCQTGIDFLEWLVSELRQQEVWRQSLPLRTVTAPVEAQLNTLLQHLTKHLASENLPGDYIRYLDSLGKPIAKYSLPYQAGFNIFPDGINTRFSSKKFQRVQISELADANGYIIRISGKEITLKGITSTFAENAFTGESFSGNDVTNWLPDCDWDIDIVPLLSRLVIEEIIFVDTHSHS